MNGNKGAISLTLDSDVIEVINKYTNRSALVNDILRERLMTENGLNEQIEKTKELLTKLGQEKIKIQEKADSYLKDVTDDFKAAIRPNNERKDGMRHLIKVRPENLSLWTSILNKRFHKAYTPEQFKKIVERWG